MKKKILTFMLAVLLSFSFAFTAFAASYHEGDIEKYIMGQLSNAKIPGGEISIVTSGKEVYSASFGDVEETTSDLKIGSLSKMFTSLAVLQLADSKKLTLDTNVGDIVTGYDKAPDITVEDLLKETSGYTAIQSIRNGSIPYPEGTKGKYQEARINYAILGKIVEEVSGSSYSDYIQKKIVKPLKLESTYTIDEKAGKDVVGGHDNLFGLPVAKKVADVNDKEWDAISATGIISDAKDIGNVLSMFLAAGGQTLSYDQIEKIYSDGSECGTTIFGTKGTSSLGWIKTTVGKQDVFYISGAIDGYISAAFLVPGRDVGITMLFDTSDVISGNNVISELMSNVVCLAIGEKARTIDSKAVMMPHIEFDIVYVIAFFASLLPLFMMSWWYRSTRNRGIGIVRTIVDIVIHIVIPVIIYQFVPVVVENVLGNSLGSWFMIKNFLPECYYVTLIVIAILLAGVPVKIIAAIVAVKKGPFDEDEEDLLDYDIDRVDDKSEKDSEESENMSIEKDMPENEEEETDSVVAEAAATDEVQEKEISENKKSEDDLGKNGDKVEEDDENSDETLGEIVKEFKTRKAKKEQQEEYESSFEREAVKALESPVEVNEQYEDEELSTIKSDSDMHTTVPKIKKKYNHQEGMPVKIVVEPDDELDN